MWGSHGERLVSLAVVVFKRSTAWKIDYNNQYGDKYNDRRRTRNPLERLDKDLLSAVWDCFFAGSKLEGYTRHQQAVVGALAMQLMKSGKLRQENLFSGR